MNKLAKVSLIGTILVLGACSDSDSVEDETAAEEQAITTDLRETINSLGLTGDPASGKEIPDMVDNPQALLGMQLFFSKALSGEMDTACVTCHHPLLGGGDDLSLPIGVEAEEPDLLGPGRKHASEGTAFDGGPTVPRNAPTTFNIALWDQSIFFDGRIESVEAIAGANGEGTQILTPDSPDRHTADVTATNLVQAQARFPVTSAEEMKGHHKSDLNNKGIRDYLIARLRGSNDDLVNNNWLEAFRLGFADADGSAESLITEANIFGAIATYEQSQVFVDTPWRAFVQGDDSAISLAAKRGAQLFFKPAEQGGANCASCHSGDFFTDEGFHNIAMIQLGRGKGDGEDGSNDWGRFRVSKMEDDKFAFRTPTLLNVEHTGPYGHSGSYDSLRDVVLHHLDPEQAIANYNQQQAIAQAGVQGDRMLRNTSEALAKLVTDRVAAKPVLRPISLTDTQVDEVLAFLETLSDKCLADKACLADWIPDDTTPDPDGLRLNAVFE